MRRVVRYVLDRIRSRCPRDFERLQSLVREIVPLSRAERRDGTIGQWIEEQPRADDQSTWGYGIDATPGKMLLAETLKPEKMPLLRLPMSSDTPARALRILNVGVLMSMMNGRASWPRIGMPAKNGGLPAR